MTGYNFINCRWLWSRWEYIYHAKQGRNSKMVRPAARTGRCCYSSRFFLKTPAYSKTAFEYLPLKSKDIYIRPYSRKMFKSLKCRNDYHFFVFLLHFIISIVTLKHTESRFIIQQNKGKMSEFWIAYLSR